MIQIQSSPPSSHLLCFVTRRLRTAKEPWGRRIQPQEKLCIASMGEKMGQSTAFLTFDTHLLKIFYTHLALGCRWIRRHKWKSWMQTRNPFRAGTPAGHSLRETLVFQSLSFNLAPGSPSLPFPAWRLRQAASLGPFMTQEQWLFGSLIQVVIQMLNFTPSVSVH